MENGTSDEIEMTAICEVLSTGVGLSIQDAGRSGWRRYGVPVGGAMDRYSAAAANRLLGNHWNAPVLEILMAGVKLQILQDTWVALAGADLGCGMSPWTAALVEGGMVLDFPLSHSGLWAYLALPGGIVAGKWFGSASVDARNGIGEPLKKGSRLFAEAAVPPASIKGIGRRILTPELQRDFDGPFVFDLLRGPQYDAFAPETRARLVRSQWTVSARSDRTGYRLEGPLLAVPESIESEPVLPGSLQIPGGGQPIITMHDGPTVGGYAKLAVMREADLDWLAQCRPGTQISFQWAD